MLEGEARESYMTRLTFLRHASDDYFTASRSARVTIAASPNDSVLMAVNIPHVPWKFAPRQDSLCSLDSDEQNFVGRSEVTSVEIKQLSNTRQIPAKTLILFNLLHYGIALVHVSSSAYCIRATHCLDGRYRDGWSACSVTPTNRAIVTY